ncbi:uncharacterized protein LOC122376391 [Amphibalanus amphitrite]|uniref:uncharacterized protein LOC122376391 n=1 Tax=Amphibalanus amphitrite TaxID=1232801 RepID=UPI001C9042CA|nr:uncharacterized protein LOC122376391 [Amphibalanus amphitrite]
MLLSHIQNHLGFSMSFTPVPGVNGSSHWGRTFSVIRDGMFDISPSSWTVSHARHALVDFTFPTVTVTVGFGIRTPDAETDTTAFLRPFDESAYAGVVLLLVLLATAAWLLDNRSRLLGEESRSVPEQSAFLGESEQVEKNGSRRLVAKKIWLSNKLRRVFLRGDLRSRRRINKTKQQLLQTSSRVRIHPGINSVESKSKTRQGTTSAKSNSTILKRRRDSTRLNAWISDTDTRQQIQKEVIPRKNIRNSSAALSQKQHNCHEEDNSEKIPMFVWLLTLFGTFSLQGSALTLQRPVSRAILLTGFATGILVCNFYNSGLYSHLTATRAAMPFSSVTELFRDSSFTIGAQVSFYFSTALSRLTGFSVTEVDRRLENHLGIHDREIERLIAKPKFAFLMTSTAFKLAVRVPPWQADRCPSCFVPLKGVPPEERAIIFRKGLDAEHGIMNRQLLRLWEGGVLARERAYWLPETLSESYRCHPGARSWDAIAVSQVYPLFVLLLTSAAASLLILAAEIIHFRWSRNGRKRATSRS